MAETPISIAEYSERTGLSKGQIYHRIKAKRIIAIRDGTLKIYPEATAAHMLELAKKQVEKSIWIDRPQIKSSTDLKKSRRKSRIIPGTKDSSFKEKLKELQRGARAVAP